MDFEFDPAKDAVNRAKHHLPLAFGQRIFDDPFAAILPSFRPIDGEYRYKASAWSTASFSPPSMLNVARQQD